MCGCNSGSTAAGGVWTPTKRARFKAMNQAGFGVAYSSREQAERHVKENGGWVVEMAAAGQ